ncbi:flavin monoamine oxidase family protein [Hoyosella subflava]|uniref:Putative monoamine oxidase n=1 Tax=Hoyosella subflava (strain DSM 45089 / JCM 17490 / NBRC 109087 / DQS3-9A1) TaxID=443218 RepID=F6EK13_HOYSD|nr:NAD(P)/FAD-dependent oxidoreductase [Hoyosella subflava]AEF41371.1 Putative monoamine oxidase [Hoyosella subflava DQS3-9A1]
MIGAGVSGLYAAWGLRTRGASSALGREPTVEVFEQSGRLGGRLYSVVPPRAPHLRAELGGMRYLPSQTIVSSLIDTLGLATRPFPITSEKNLVHLRGTTMRVSELSDPGRSLPYQLREGERGAGPTELIGRAIIEHIPDCLEFSRSDWPAVKASREVMGRPLTDLSLRSLLDDTLSPDAVQLAAMGEGYETFLRDYNAADAIQILLSLVTQDYRTPVDGYQALPLALAEAFTKSGGTVTTGTRLITLERASGRRTRCILDTGGEISAVDAQAVILAIPRAAIEALDQTSFLFDSRETRADISAVAPVPASKLFLAFDEPWWEEIAGDHGNLATDLPLRQVVYFGHEGDGGPGLLLASYNNSFSTWYWEAEADRGGPYFAGPAAPDSEALAPIEMVADARNKLQQAYGRPVPEPYWAAFRDWNRPPYGGGWSQWRVGARSYEIMPRIRAPLPGRRVYICGDTWSDMQGWVDGALSTAERVLQDHLGVPAPEWLPTGTQLGP